MKERIKDAFLDIFFPRFCFGCNREGSYICPICTLFLSQSKPICPICGGESFYGKTHKVCKDKGNLEGIIIFWDYEGMVKKIIKGAIEESFFKPLEELIDYSLFSLMEEKKRFDLFLDFLLDKRTVLTYLPLDKSEGKRVAFHISKRLGKEVFSLKSKSFSKRKVVLISDVFLSGEEFRRASLEIKRKGGEEVWALSLSRRFR